MDTKQKSEERRLRRALDRRGMDLSRSRARDPLSPTYGRYQIVDRSTGLVIGGEGYRMDFDAIDLWLHNTAATGQHAPLPDEDVRLMAHQVRVLVAREVLQLVLMLSQHERSQWRITKEAERRRLEGMMKEAQLRLGDLTNIPIGKTRDAMEAAILRVLSYQNRLEPGQSRAAVLSAVKEGLAAVKAEVEATPPYKSPR